MRQEMNVCINTINNLPSPSNKLPLLRKEKRHQHKRKDSTHNTKEPVQMITTLSRHMYIHAKETTNQVEWNKDSRDGCDLAKYLIGTVVCLDRVHRELCEIIGVRSRQHFLEVGQIAHHGNNVICNHIIN